MKNLINCHVKGLHSFPISLDKNGFYRRIFYADYNHELHIPFSIAIHPHHVDIKITVLKGELTNIIYDKAATEAPVLFSKFLWNSHILNGNGGFEFIGTEFLNHKSSKTYKRGDVISMKACELHTVYVEKGEVCVWLIEETVPTCEYFPINYSLHDLQNWTSDGLYIEADDSVKEAFLSNVDLLQDGKEILLNQNLTNL